MKNKAAIASALRNIADNIEKETDTLSPWEMLFETPPAPPAVKQDIDVDELNDLFHETICISGRTLNHSLNKVAKDWRMKNLRTPRGSRALIEVAVDARLTTEDLCGCILLNPRFKDGPIGDAARELLG